MSEYQYAQPRAESAADMSVDAGLRGFMLGVFNKMALGLLVSAVLAFVAFTVENKTGKISNPTVDSAKSDAPAEVGECVVSKIDGLAIAEPDMRDGAASFVWELGN